MSEFDAEPGDHDDYDSDSTDPGDYIEISRGFTLYMVTIDGSYKYLIKDYDRPRDCPQCGNDLTCRFSAVRRSSYLPFTASPESLYDSVAAKDQHCDFEDVCEACFFLDEGHDINNMQTKYEIVQSFE